MLLEKSFVDTLDQGSPTAGPQTSTGPRAARHRTTESANFQNACTHPWTGKNNKLVTSWLHHEETALTRKDKNVRKHWRQQKRKIKYEMQCLHKGIHILEVTRTEQGYWRQDILEVSHSYSCHTFKVTWSHIAEAAAATTIYSSKILDICFYCIYFTVYSSMQNLDWNHVMPCFNILTHMG